MKLHFITALLGIGMSATSLAAEAFRVYAPASKTQTLWIVDALPREDGGSTPFLPNEPRTIPLFTAFPPKANS